MKMQPSTLSTMTREQAIQTLADYFKPSMASTPEKPDICDWAEKNYYLAPGSSTESHSRIPTPIKLMPHQKAILRFAFHNPQYKITTTLYSTVKKSGKTAIGGLVARYFAENSGYYAEVYCVANDEEQARGRNYKAALESIENTPGYNKHREELAGKWNILSRELQYLPTHSFIQALSNDYRGQAGANPTCVVWSEIWGLDSEKSRKLWVELTPVPTRPSVRFVETYAGYTGESELLEALWDSAKLGRQLTREDMPDWPIDQFGPDDNLLPCWLNENAQLFAYIDQGEVARRMPWQTPEYYIQQANDDSLTEADYRRFHYNEWTSTETPLFPVQWWKNCHTANTGKVLQPLNSQTPLVMGIDAGTTNDYTAVAIVSREAERECALRFLEVWKPPQGDVIRFNETPGESTGLTVEDYIIKMCADYNIVYATYDPSQMRYLASKLESEWIVACDVFDQGARRLAADKQWHDMIRDKRFHHEEVFPAMEEAIEGAAKKQGKDEDNKMRIIKKGAKFHIDPIIATDMATELCLYLNLW